MRKTLLITTPVAALAVVAALAIHAAVHQPTPTPASITTSTTTPSTPPATQPTAEPSASNRIARGPAASTTITNTTGIEQRATAFILTAATPDTRIDPTPTAAWKRAAAYTTPRFAHELATQKDPTPDSWWRDMTAHDGWVSIRITNILTPTPQAPDAPRVSADTLTVIFLPTYHTTTAGHDHTTNDQHPHTWTLHLHNNLIDSIEPDAQH